MKRLMRHLIPSCTAFFLAVVQAEAAETKKIKSPTIVISFDGAQPGVIEQMLKTGKLSKDGGFARMIQAGTQAKGMASVLPTVTATNHITIATGAFRNEPIFRATCFISSTRG